MRAPERELPMVARLVVAVVVVAGIVAAIPGGFSLLWFIPYGAVGALLVIRRPRTSIGWLLLTLGWLFILVTVAVDETPEQFTAGAVGPASAALVVVGALAGPLIFLLFAVLASVFPSGRLPAGRWGRVARAALGVGAALVALYPFMPTITANLWGADAPVAVRNPAAILPDLPLWQVLTSDTAILPIAGIMVAAAVSLFVRYRRAAGVERQQLRWITASIAFVVVAVVGGFTLGAAFPALGESGLVWLGAIVAFPCVPLAVGTSVLRYRLYEIDTIINRAVVYGLVTALLAGASAAVIGITKQLFEGVMGPGSELSFVISTLVVVSIFEPVKKAVGSLVDRLLAESSDPADVLQGLTAEVRASLTPPDPERTLRRFLEVGLVAYHATDGMLTWEVGAGPAHVLRAGGTAAIPKRRRRAPSGSPLTATASTGPITATVNLSGASESSSEDALGPALAAVLAELAGPGVIDATAPISPEAGARGLVDGREAESAMSGHADDDAQRGDTVGWGDLEGVEA